MRTFIERLEDVEQPNLAELGGKAFHLVKIIHAGLPVPAGFCITAAAFNRFLGVEGLSGEILTTIEHLSWARLETIKKGSRAIGELIRRRNFPEIVRTSILSAWRDLVKETDGSLNAAVRSSATSEDRPDLSFAGQYDSYLNINSEEELLEAIKSCWASLYSDRALTYYRHNHLDYSAVSMAVVIQQLIPAEVSGVMFTAHPVSQERDDILIHAAWGLGEAIVGGKTAVDEFVVDRSNMEISQQKISEKKLMTMPVERGTADFPVPAPRQKLRSLTGKQILDLAEMGRKLEDLFKVPQDIEWALASGRIFVLQSRPITTLIDIIWGNTETRKLFEGQLVYWSNFNTRETLPYPLTPLSASYFLDLLFPVANRCWLGISARSKFYAYGISLDLIYNRLYWNMNMVFSTPLGKHLHKLDHEAGSYFEKIDRQKNLFTPKPKNFFLRMLLSLFFISRLLRILFHAPWFSGISGFKRRNLALLKRAREFESLDLSTMSISRLVEVLKKFNIDMAGLGFPMLLVTAVYALIGINLLEKLTRKWRDIPFHTLLAGIEGNKTTEGALALFELSLMSSHLKGQFINTQNEEIPAMLERSEEGKRFQKRLEAFLEDFGHRGVGEFDIGHPRWREDPSFIFQMVRNYLQLEEGDETPPVHFMKMKQEREDLTAMVLKHLSPGFFSRLFPFRKWWFRWALKKVHFYIPQRENNKYYALLFFFSSRRLLLEIGSRFCQKGVLERREDIFYLTLPELESPEWRESQPEKMKGTIRTRREAWEKNRKIEPPLIVRSDGRVFDYTPDLKIKMKSGCLTGAAVSSGRASGKARVIMDPTDGSTFNKGEILVAPFTDPGWTPLFLTAKALVMETGGMFSHGAVVAREYGIPAVVGVKGATEMIRTGDEVTVDGDEGNVFYRVTH